MNETAKMKYRIASIATLTTLSACGPTEPRMAQVFPDLAENTLEIRMGYLPELGDAVCDRNMYAGFRTDNTEVIHLNLDLVVMRPGASMDKYERRLTLAPLKQKGWLAGQTRLFPEPIKAACNEVHVKMMTLYCTYGSNEEQRPCPTSRRWNWLQGFKMIETPKVQ